MPIWISEAEFRAAAKVALELIDIEDFKFVTGPGRSGALAAVYVSHMTGLAFRPHKCVGELHDCGLLIVDTVAMSGRTIESAVRWYRRYPIMIEKLLIFPVSEKRHKFWYEEGSPV